MRSFDKIEAVAGKHHGGPKGIARKLGEWGDDAKLAGKKDATLLSGMAKAVFSSGFSWQVIEKKWPRSEVAFDKFDPKKVAAYSEEKIDDLLKARISQIEARFSPRFSRFCYINQYGRRVRRSGRWLRRRVKPTGPICGSISTPG